MNDNDGLPIIESGNNWSIAQRPDGSFIRHYVGQVDQIFTSLNRALDDCGVLPEDPDYLAGYDDHSQFMYEGAD